ncbi:hypothetical protein [Aurantibacter aestuarii]|uniref:Uncharacterized protein n=1 Tax=Aurantibacter aestuarii TaxID=1266046 RepID=A0A2T1NDV4_9FLAO|nr:hypothetical protein [Aurantibacter aestuarii]PSG90610.1 hypothetical protein C7H52_04825 [Aurantibacter aestuarii]
MKTHFYIYLFILFTACKQSYENANLTDTITLKWHKAYDEDSLDKSMIGLQWALSYTGAYTPCNLGVMTVKNDLITIDLKKLSYNTKGHLALLNITEKVKHTEGYRKNKYIDIGRFVTLILGNPNYYYALSQTPKTLKDLKQKYNLSNEKVYINNSSVAIQDRVISFSEQEKFNQVFISEEVDSITKQVYEFETIELLPNGQLRFGIYDFEGNLKSKANPKFSKAGKPAKCIWCHESKLNPLFREQKSFEAFLSPEAFQKKIKESNLQFTKDRSLLNGTVDFNNKQQHTLAELLYISFLQPNAKRLSSEWNMSEAKVKEFLKSIKTTKHDEFPFLGAVYNRKEIETFEPSKWLSTPAPVRE